MLNEMKLVKYFSTIASTILLSACDLFSPTSYDDCILKYIKANQNMETTTQIRKSCAAKYKEANDNRDKSRELTESERTLVTGKGGIDAFGYFRGPIHNGNSNILVTEVSLEIKTISGGVPVSKVYAAQIVISPLTTTELLIPVIAGDEGTRSVPKLIAARGLEIEK